MAQNLESRLKVVRAMPGRLRLRTTGSSTVADLLSEKLDAIARQLKQEKGVRNVQTNSQIGSLVVNFDPSILSLSQLLERLQHWGVLATQAFSSEAKQTEPLAALQSGDFWQEQLKSIIPIVAGLLTVRGLKVQGLWSIPVYVIVASFIRKLMEQLEHDFVTPLGAGVGGKKAEPSELRSQVEPGNENREDNEDNEDKGASIPPLVRGIRGDRVLSEEAIAYRVLHTIPGRLRLQVAQITKDSQYARRLEQLAQETSWITSIRLNRTAASVVVTYEKNALSVWAAVSQLVSLIQAAGEMTAPTASVSNIAHKDSSPMPEEEAEDLNFTDETSEASFTNLESDVVESDDSMVDGEGEEAIASPPSEHVVSNVTADTAEVEPSTQSPDNETVEPDELTLEEEPPILAPAVAKFWAWVKQCLSKGMSHFTTQWFELHSREPPNTNSIIRV